MHPWTPPESTTKTSSWSVQPFLQGSRSWQTDRQTDRPRLLHSVTIGRYVTIWYKTEVIFPERSGTAATYSPNENTVTVTQSRNIVLSLFRQEFRHQHILEANQTEHSPFHTSTAAKANKTTSWPQLSVCHHDCLLIARRTCIIIHNKPTY